MTRLTQPKDEVINYLLEIQDLAELSNLERTDAEQIEYRKYFDRLHDFLQEKLERYEPERTNQLIAEFKKTKNLATEETEAQVYNRAYFTLATNLLANFARFNKKKQMINRAYVCFYYCAMLYNYPEAWERLAELNENKNYRDNLKKLVGKYIIPSIKSGELASLQNYYDKYLHSDFTTIFLLQRALHEHSELQSHAKMLELAAKIIDLFEKQDDVLASQFTQKTLLQISERLIEDILPTTDTDNIRKALQIINQNNKLVLRHTPICIGKPGIDIHQHLQPIFSNYEFLLQTINPEQAKNFSDEITTSLLTIEKIAEEYQKDGSLRYAIATQQCFIEYCKQYKLLESKGQQYFLTLITDHIKVYDQITLPQDRKAEHIEFALSALNYLLANTDCTTIKCEAYKLKQACLTKKLNLCQLLGRHIKDDIQSQIDTNQQALNQLEQSFEDVKEIKAAVEKIEWLVSAVNKTDPKKQKMAFIPNIQINPFRKQTERTQASLAALSQEDEFTHTMTIRTLKALCQGYESSKNLIIARQKFLIEKEDRSQQETDEIEMIEKYLEPGNHFDQWQQEAQAKLQQAQAPTPQQVHTEETKSDDKLAASPTTKAPTPPPLPNKHTTPEAPPLAAPKATPPVAPPLPPVAPPLPSQNTAAAAAAPPTKNPSNTDSGARTDLFKAINNLRDNPLAGLKKTGKTEQVQAEEKKPEEQVPSDAMAAMLFRIKNNPQSMLRKTQGTHNRRRTPPKGFLETALDDRRGKIGSGDEWSDDEAEKDESSTRSSSPT